MLCVADIVVEKELEVLNSSGIHVRPASMIVRALQDSDSTVEFIYNNVTVNAKSVLSILIMIAPQYSKIHVRICGKDANDLMDKLTALFRDKFGED